MADHNQRYNDTFWKTAVRMWPLVVALISVIAMATTIKNKVEDHDTRISRVENSLESIKLDTNRLVYELLGRGRRERPR